MAASLSITAGIREIDTELSVDSTFLNSKPYTSSRNEELQYHATVNVSATAADLVIDPVVNAGWAYLHNTSDTYYIQIGIDVSATFYPVLRLSPGSRFPLELEPGITYQVQGEGVCQLRIGVFERNS